MLYSANSMYNLENNWMLVYITCAGPSQIEGEYIKNSVVHEGKGNRHIRWWVRNRKPYTHQNIWSNKRRSIQNILLYTRKLSSTSSHSPSVHNCWIIHKASFVHVHKEYKVHSPHLEHTQSLVHWRVKYSALSRQQLLFQTDHTQSLSAERKNWLANGGTSLHQAGKRRTCAAIHTEWGMPYIINMQPSYCACMHYIRDSLKMYVAGPLSTTFVAKLVGNTMTRYVGIYTNNHLVQIAHP